MKIAVRARVRPERGGAEPAAIATRASRPVEPMETASRASPAAPSGFSLDQTPIEAPAAPALRVLAGGLASVTSSQVEAPPASTAPATSTSAPARSTPINEGLLGAAAVAEPPVPLPDRSAHEMALGRSLAHVTLRSGPATRAALDTLGADGAAAGGDVFVRALPSHGSVENEGPARRVLGHELAHAASTAPVAPRRAGSEEAAENAGTALAAAAASFHEPVAPAPPPRPLDRREVEQAAPGEGAAGLRRAIERPSAPAASLVDGDPAASFADEPGRGAVDRAPRDGGPRSAPQRETGASGQHAAAEPVPAVVEAGRLDVERPASGPGGAGAEAPGGLAPTANDDVDGVIAAFASAPPSQKARSVGVLGESLNAHAQASTTAAEDALPDLQARMSGATAMEAVDPSLLVPAVTEPTAIEASAAPAPIAEQVVPDAPGGAAGWSAPSPGPAPAVPLQGATDPARIEEQRAVGLGQATGGLASARTAIAAAPGPEAIQPLEINTAVALEGLESPTIDAQPPVDGIEQFNQAAMPEDVVATFDQQNAAAMQASLAGAQQQVDEAVGARDDDWQTELDAASVENQALIDGARADQDAVVEAQREHIQEERLSTLDRQDAEVARVREEADALRDDQIEAIEQRVADDEATIAQHYATATEKAEAKIADGDRRTEAEQREAGASAEDESWLGAAGDQIGDAVNALAGTVAGVLDEVRSAVDAVLAAAREVAVGIIELASQFIQEAIAAYGSFLTGLVTELLGDVFPALAAALADAINAAVTLARQAVQTVADDLNAGVNALADTVKAGLNAVLDAYQAAVNFAGAMINAALVGDWDQVLRLLLDAALQLAGIDPAEFYAFVGKIDETIGIIVNDPVGFVGNVFGAVQLGVDRFIENIAEHLKTGFFEWIVGPLGELGITLPETWDVWGILGIVLQVLGLTQQGIRGVIVEELGDGAGAVFDFVWRYVEALVTGGWQGLWEQIGGDLSMLWASVVDGIKDWLATKIITEGAQKLLSMIDPSGISQVVQVVKAAWGMYTFLRDEVQRIWGVVKSIVDTVSEIAHGVLQSAGGMVEDALGDLVPIAISLLANLLGFGDITQRVQEIIEGVREKVRDAIRNLIRKARELFTGEGPEEDEEAEDGEEVSDLGARMTVSTGEEEHSVWIEVDGENATVMAASEVAPIQFLLAHFRSEAAKPEHAANKENALKYIENAAAAVADLDAKASDAANDSSSPDSDTSAFTAKRESILKKQKDLMDALLQVMQELGIGKLDPARRIEMFMRESDYRPSQLPAPVFEPADAAKAVDGPYTTSSRKAWQKPDYLRFFSELGKKGTSEALTNDDWEEDRKLALDTPESGIARLGGSQYVILEAPPAVVGEVRRVGVDRRLEAAVKQRGVYGLLLSLAVGDKTVGLDAEELDKLWGNGTRNPNRDFLEPRFRSMKPHKKREGLKSFKAHHEWLPTNLMLEVVLKADPTNKDVGFLEAANWIYVYSEMRTPTRQLIFKPSDLQRVETSPGLQQPALHGHVGALYVDVQKKTGPKESIVAERFALFEGQDPWHEELRKRFHSSHDPATAVRSVLEYFKGTIWNGEDAVPAGVVETYYRSQKGVKALSIADLMLEQATHYKEILNMFAKIEAMLSARRADG